MTLTTGTATSFITFSRASTATRINASGLVEAVASGAARIDYDPVTLAAKGLLVEEQRTNLLTYSEQFDNAAWTKLGLTVTANAIASPDGTTSADKIVADATTGIKYFHELVATSASTTYSWSIFLKAAEYTTAVIYAINPNSPFQYFQASVDLTTGVISGTTSGNGGTFTSATATSCGNGWWRVSLIGIVGTGTSVVARVYPNTIGSFTGNGTSGIYAWGAQLELGSFPTSYIPTTSATVTRSADVASVATSSFPYSATEGTLIVKSTPPNYAAAASGGVNPTVAVLNDGTLNNRIMVLRGAGSTDPTFRVSVSGVDQALFSPASTGTWPNGTTRTVALAWAANDFAGCINGGAVATDTSGTIPTVNMLALGSISGSGHLNGHIRQIAYIPRRLSNAELQARSA